MVLRNISLILPVESLRKDRVHSIITKLTLKKSGINMLKCSFQQQLLTIRF